MLRQHRRVVRTAALGLTVACGSGIFSAGNMNFEATADFSESIPVDNRTRLDVTGINGAVSVTGDALTGTIVVSGTRKVRSESVSDAEARLEDIEVVITEQASRLVVETRHLREPNGRSYEVEYEISVPPGFALNIVNVNGAIVVSGIDGDVDLLNTNGAIVLEAVTGNLDVDVTNGAIVAEATMSSGGSIDLRTTNGEVQLSVPAATSATFEAALVNGTITITNLTLSNQSVTGQRVTGTLGSGNGTIQLHTTNGGIVAIGL